MMDTRFLGDDDLALFFLIHKAIRLEVRALARVAPSVDPRDATRIDALAQRFAFLTSAIHKHHTGEDEHLYPLLSSKDASFDRDRRILEGEHVLLAPLEENLGRALKETRSGKRANARDALVDGAERFASAMFAHLDREEAAVIPRMKAFVTVAELKALEAEMGKHTSLREIGLILPWILESANEHEKALLDEALPWLAKVLYRVSWKQKYARLANPFVGLRGAEAAA